MSHAALTFHGAVQHVTGSMHLGSCGETSWAIDCGLIQGSRTAEADNYAPWPVDPASLSCVVLTHAHVDHSGRLPKLVLDGFHGPIHSTDATRELAEVLLLDSAKLQVEEARYRYRIDVQRGRDPELNPFTRALYDAPAVATTMRKFRSHPLGNWVQLGPGVDLRFHEAGHILGSAHAELRVKVEGAFNGQARVLYSGDIGRYGSPLMRDPAPPRHADVIVMEATYGDRLHDRRDPGGQLAEMIRETYARGGVVLIPAFAVGRTQSLLWHIAELERKAQIPIRPVFLDSPMARRATALYKKYPGLLDPPIDGEPHDFALPEQFVEVSNPKLSKRLNERHAPCTIIAASGMLSGGRVLHHLRQRAPIRENLILMSGYQAEGTLGRRVLDGASEVRLFGTDLPVRAEVRSLGGLSAHADRDELLRWARGFDPPPAQAFVVHGEDGATAALVELLRTELGWRIEVPDFNQTFELRDLL